MHLCNGSSAVRPGPPNGKPPCDRERQILSRLVTDILSPVESCLQELSISAQKGTGEAFAVKSCVTGFTCGGREPTRGDTGVSGVR